jgi:hypothetical protein
VKIMLASSSRAGSSLKAQRKASFIILLGGLIAGALFGLAAWLLLFTNSQGFSLVSIGRFDNTSPRPDQPTQANWVEDPQVVVERMKSQGFAKSVAERAQQPELATLLPAKQYGGSGALNVRSLRDPSLLEIKISSKDPNTVRTAIEAVVAELISEHTTRVEPLLRDAALKLQSLKDLAADARKSHDQLTKLLDASPRDENAQQALTLLALKSVADSNLATLEKATLEVETASSGRAARNTRVIQAPTISTPKISSLFQTMVLAALAGIIFAILYLQLRPRSYQNKIFEPDEASSPPVHS